MCFWGKWFLLVNLTSFRKLIWRPRKFQLFQSESKCKIHYNVSFAFSINFTHSLAPLYSHALFFELEEETSISNDWLNLLVRLLRKRENPLDGQHPLHLSRGHILSILSSLETIALEINLRPINANRFRVRRFASKIMAFLSENPQPVATDHEWRLVRPIFRL